MSKKLKKIVVNGLTISRIIGAFIMPIVFSIKGMETVIILLACLFITDFLDGRLSRYWHVQTLGGKYLDPVGDKLLAAASIFIMMSKYNYLWIILLLECSIAIVNTIKVLKNDAVKSSILGKAKTWLLSSTLVLFAISYINPDLLSIMVSKIGIEANLAISEELLFNCALITIGGEIVTFLSYLMMKDDSKVLRKKPKSKKKLSYEEIFNILFDEELFAKNPDKAFFDYMSK